MPIQLIVGLGNPGPKYEKTRHNIGFWFIDALAHERGVSLRIENKFHGEVVKLSFAGQSLWLQKPMTYMNRSGQALGALANFYKIPATEVLVVHDELDLPPGQVRLKQGGGHGGHNGLRDIISQLGSKDFYRLRIGIGHPGTAAEVTNYVLGSAPKAEQQILNDCVNDCLLNLSMIVEGDMQKAMNHLHSRK